MAFKNSKAIQECVASRSFILFIIRQFQNDDETHKYIR